jgi:hypothetical protein
MPSQLSRGKALLQAFLGAKQVAGAVLRLRARKPQVGSGVGKPVLNDLSTRELTLYPRKGF